MASPRKPSPHPLVSYQPLRLVFQLAYLATVLVRLPYYLVQSLVPSLRPHPSWSIKQTFMTRVAYSILDMTSRVGITEPLSLESGKEGDRFQVVAPSARPVYRGPLESSSVRPASVGGTWFPHAPSEGTFKGKTVFLYFHGGAFVQGDGRDANCGPIAHKLLQKGGADLVFSLQYRLSGHGDLNPFPAALQDALSSYLFLLDDLHIDADRIILAGDSAGGNLATALVRYLSEFGPSLDIPSPRAAVLISSWVAPYDYDRTGNPHSGTDFIPSSFPAWGAHAYGDPSSSSSYGPGGAADPYITPLGNPFPTRGVAVFAHAGTAEMFLERITRWAHEMRGVDGNLVEVYHEEAAVHDTFLSGELLGFEDSAWDVAEAVGRFVAGL